MGKIVVGTFLSVDGVYQAPGSPDEDRDGGFEYGGWTVPYTDSAVGERVTEATLRPDAMLLGRKTYEIFAGYWPYQSSDDPVAAKINSMPKFVVSRTQRELAWDTATLLSGDIPEAIVGLKERYDLVGVTGSGDLVQTLLRHDLVDELQLLVFPVLIGSGKRLFGAGASPGALTLVETTTTDSGVGIHTYQRAGQIPLGTFE
jgi:dihydrofolate reductase